MIKMRNFLGSNKNLNVIEQKGIFTVFEHVNDVSTFGPNDAMAKYFMAQMNCRKRQVLVQLKDNAIRLRPGEMQFMSGSIQQTTGVTGVGDFLGKALKSKMTGDAPIKPLYKGSGILVTEATYEYPLIEDVSEWGPDGVVCDDGMFICCDDEVQDTVVMRSNLSSAIAGGEGLFNLCLKGNGLAIVKSPCPREELYEITLENDCIKIDGNNAICWSGSLDFTVERSGKSLIGSAASGEGLVNVYRGTGKILMTPLK